MKQNYINHIAYVIDASGSMAGLSDEVVSIFDSQIKYLSKRSQDLNQETRVSVYTFNTHTECLFFDMDVMRLPSLKSLYNPGGGTALIDATLKTIADLKDTSTLYGDHAFLMYIQTDGEENSSRNNATQLAKDINGLEENWTLGVLVPDKVGAIEAKRFGFPASNISIWEVGVKGLQEAATVMQKSANTFMENRAKGIRGTKNLFTVDTAGITKTAVNKTLQELKSSEYYLLNVSKDAVIKPFVESWTKEDYVPGSVYYMLTKSETVQAHKQVCIQDRKNGKVYSGVQARSLLGLPDQEAKVKPDNHGQYEIFVQSTSQNRKLIAGTKVIVLV